MAIDPALAAQLPFTLTGTDLPALGTRYVGKVRDTYAQGDRLVLVATDRLSAFDRVLTTLPFKGEVLNRLAGFWFDRTRDVVKNHVLEMPDPNVTVARRCEPIAVEVVVRGHLTGSLWRDLQKGTHTVYGVAIPPDMRKDAAFPAPIITPSTKEAVGEHDQPISVEGLLARGLTTARDWARIQEAALALFEAGRTWAASRGLILVDTKYEFGKVGDALYVIDEIHTPDSSRFWVASEYADRFARGVDQRMLDKENLRQWLLNEAHWDGNGESPVIPDEVRVDLASKYTNAYEAITGETLKLEVGPVGERIERNLRSAGLL